MKNRRYHGRTLIRGILVDRGRMIVRIYHKGRMHQQYIGKASVEGVYEDAVAYLHKLRQEIRQNKLGIKSLKENEITMAEAIAVYKKYRLPEVRAQRTLRIKLKLIGSYFKKKYIHEISYMDIKKYREYREKTVSPSTTNREHSTIIHLYNSLKKWVKHKVIEPVKLPEENPGSLVKMADESKYVRKRLLSEDEFQRLMTVSDEALRHIILMALYTTLRISDLKKLTKDNINADLNQLEGIQQKTQKAYSISINPTMQKIIDQAEGEQLLDFTNFKFKFDQVRVKANLKDFRFHDLRRSGARKLLDKGTDYATVSSYLGHADIRTTQAYVPTLPQHKKEASKKLESAFVWNP